MCDEGGGGGCTGSLGLYCMYLLYMQVDNFFPSPSLFLPNTIYLFK